jgi:predicted membrane protein
MESKSRFSLGPMVVGALLVVLGILWLLDNLEMMDFGRIISTFWPLILITIGVINLVTYRSFKNMSGWILIVLGGVFLLATLEVVEWSDVFRMWPVVLILMGFSILLGWKGGRRRETSRKDDLHVTAIFSGVERNMTTESFRGGEVSAMFGGAEVDLTASSMAAEGGLLRLSATFGGVTVKLPRDWEIEVRASSILGGVEDKTRQSQETKGGKLTITASAVFGGVEIQN